MEGENNIQKSGKRLNRKELLDLIYENGIRKLEATGITEEIRKSFKAPTFEEIEEGLRKRSEKY